MNFMTFIFGLNSLKFISLNQDQSKFNTKVSGFTVFRIAPMIFHHALGWNMSIVHITYVLELKQILDSLGYSLGYISIRILREVFGYTFT